MKSLLIFLFLAGSATGTLGQTAAPGLGSAELRQPEHVAFSFKYHGKKSAQLLTIWKSSQENAPGGAARLASIQSLSSISDVSFAVGWDWRSCDLVQSDFEMDAGSDGL